MELITAAATTASTAPLLADSVSLVEAISYICVGLGALIAGVVGYRKKTNETVSVPQPTPDIAAQVAAAMGERDNQRAVAELTEAIREQIRLQRGMDDTLLANRTAHHDLIHATNRLTDRIDKLLSRLGDRF